MPAPTSYIFYGLVEDTSDPSFENLDPEAFGYTAGQQITAHLTLTDSVAATWITLPESGRFMGIAPDLAQVETEFLFPQTGNLDWTQADFVSAVSLGSSDDKRPLEDFRATLFHTSEPDGPNLFNNQLEFGGVQLSNDDSLYAFVTGAWVPAGVTPNLVYGTSGEDVLRASAPLSLVWGGMGDDDIRVKRGEAFAWGGDGDDTIRGNSGDDFIWGGIGDDILDGSAGNDFLNGEWGNDVIEGGSGDDRVDGGSGSDVIRGGAGNDVLDSGGGGIDRVFGGAGDDFIVSGTGGFDENFEFERSSSSGGSGDDIILASFDAILSGGQGADTFVLGRLFGETGRLGGLTVTDFRPGLDRLSITAGEPGRFDTFEEIMAAGEQVGSDVVFDFFPEEIHELPLLVLEDVLMINLRPGDFLFGDF